MKKAILSPILEKGRLYKAGNEDELEKVATPAQLQDWRKRDLIEGRWKGLNSEPSEEGPTLEDKLVGILMRGVGERGDDEGAVDVLERIVRERDNAEAEVLALQSQIRNDEGTGLLDRLKGIGQERDSLRGDIAEVAGSLSGALGLERSSEESALQFLQRIAREPQELLARLTTLRARVETEAQPVQGLNDSGAGNSANPGAEDPEKQEADKPKADKPKRAAATTTVNAGE